MTLSRLVIKNIARRRGRALFTLLGITIGIASFVAFFSLSGGLKREIHRESAALGANLIVTPKGSCAYEQVSILTGEILPTTITKDDIAAIRTIDGISAVPVLTEKTAIANRPVAVNGVLPQDMMRFKGWEIARGDYFASADDPAAVLGSVAAARFSLGPGDVITVRGERLPVRGVLKETGGKDDATVFLPLATAQRLFRTGERVSYVAVRVADLAQVNRAAERITDATGLGVVSDKQMLRSVLAIVGSVHATLQMIAAVAVLAAAFGIINTMMTATFERKREIGVLQAMGARRSTIFSLFLIESAFYGLAGGAAGICTGLLVSTVAAPSVSQNAFFSFVKGSGNGLIDPAMMLGSLVLSVVISVLAGLYPAWRAARLSPVEAISYE